MLFLMSQKYDVHSTVHFLEKKQKQQLDLCLLYVYWNGRWTQSKQSYQFQQSEAQLYCKINDYSLTWIESLTWVLGTEYVWFISTRDVNVSRNKSLRLWWITTLAALLMGARSFSRSSPYSAEFSLEKEKMEKKRYLNYPFKYLDSTLQWLTSEKWVHRLGLCWVCFVCFFVVVVVCIFFPWSLFEHAVLLPGSQPAYISKFKLHIQSVNSRAWTKVHISWNIYKILHAQLLPTFSVLFPYTMLIIVIYIVNHSILTPEDRN